jgi:hypothetical protein
MVMTEHSMLFNDAMARAIQEGRKTQTRRPIKPQPDACPNCDNQGWFAWGPTDDPEQIQCEFCETVENSVFNRKKLSPYHVGDQVVVREAWASGWRAREGEGSWDVVRTDDPRDVLYRADSPHYVGYKIKWRSSRCMPLEFCRNILTITETGAERLWDISEADVIAESIELGRWAAEPEEGWPATANFAEAWDAIYAKKGYGWDANPWVWRLAFTVQHIA